MDGRKMTLFSRNIVLKCFFLSPAVFFLGQNIIYQMLTDVRDDNAITVRRDEKKHISKAILFSRYYECNIFPSGPVSIWPISAMTNSNTY